MKTNFWAYLVDSKRMSALTVGYQCGVDLFDFALFTLLVN